MRIQEITVRIAITTDHEWLTRSQYSRGLYFYLYSPRIYTSIGPMTLVKVTPSHIDVDESLDTSQAEDLFEESPSYVVILNAQNQSKTARLWNTFQLNGVVLNSAILLQYVNMK